MLPKGTVRASESVLRGQRPGSCHRSLATHLGTADPKRREPANGEFPIKRVLDGDRTPPRRRNPARAFIEWNDSASRRLDDLLFPRSWGIRAGADFRERISPGLLRPGLTSGELAAAATRSFLREKTRPTAYDHRHRHRSGRARQDTAGRLRSDISSPTCVSSEATTPPTSKTASEHVEDIDRAFAGLVSLLRPGGTLAVWVPCRNAWFARLNLLLAQRAKRRVLFSIWPHKAAHQGFPARYDRCTPSHFRALARRHGTEVLELSTYWNSGYFRFSCRCGQLWRQWQICARPVAGDRICKAFLMVAVARPEVPRSQGVFAT